MGGPPKKTNSEKEGEVKKGGGGEEGRGKRKKGEEKKRPGFGGRKGFLFFDKKLINLESPHKDFWFRSIGIPQWI